MGDTQDILKTSILGLPEERQRQIAIEDGYSSFEQWREDTLKRLQGAREHMEKFQWGVRPDGFTEEDAKRFQAKVNSSMPRLVEE